jgi:hypothetical protein
MHKGVVTMAGKKKFTMKDEFVEGDEFTLTNVKCKWAALIQPDTRYEHKWKIDVILTKKLSESLKSVGFNVKTDKDGDLILRVIKKTRTKSGTPMEAPRCVGLDGSTPFTERIGNGSTVNIKIYAKYIEVSGETHLPAYINAVQVVDLVPYKGGSDFDDLSGDGGASTGDDVPF